jgi:hypothetical protein
MPSSKAAQFAWRVIISFALLESFERYPRMGECPVERVISRRMVIHIRGGKGRQDVMSCLVPLLEALRDFWHGLKRKVDRR